MKKELVTEDGITYKKHSMSKKDKKNSVLYMLASILGVMVFFILPFFVVIYYALVDNPINHQFVGLDNFIRILQNSSFLQAAKNTATFSLVAVPLAVILSLVMAMILEENIPMKSQFRTFFLSPMMVPVASIVLIWQVLFDYNGAINEFVKNLGGAPIDWFKSSYSQIVIVVLFLWKNLGYNMILFLSGFSTMNNEILEASKIDGANEYETFKFISVPLLSPTIFFVVIITAISSFQVFDLIYVMTQGGPLDSTNVLVYSIYKNAFEYFNVGKASALAYVLFAIVLILTIFQWHIRKKMVYLEKD